MPPGGIQTANAVVEALHQDARHGGDRFELLSTKRPGTEEIPGILYSFRERDKRGGTVDLSIYLGTGTLGGSLWEQEMRVLERIGVLEHPALPQLVGGGHMPAQADLPGVAYVRVRTGLDSGPATNLPQIFAGGPEGQLLATEYLWHLSDALGILHDARVSHRNLWPGTLVTDRDASGQNHIRLGRFEMSAMVANLLSSRGTDAGIREQVRKFYMSQDPRSRMYMPPERLMFGFGETPFDLVTPVADVFSLGMIAAEWFLGSAALGHAFDSVNDVRASQERVRVAVERSGLPATLRAVLAGMLDPHPSSRWLSSRVTTELSRHFETARTTADAYQVNAPHMVVYMPGEKATDLTLGKWGFLQESTDNELGRAEAVQLIESDLAGASVYHSPEGATPFVKGSSSDARGEATTVLVGKKLIWFVAHYWIAQGWGGARITFDHAVVIKYVLEKSRHREVLDALKAYSTPRSIFKVEAVASDDGDVEWFTEMGEVRPSWRPLTNPPVLHGRVIRSSERQYLEAMAWYIEYQEALLEGRQYPFVRRPGGAASEVVIAWDRDRERYRSSRLKSLKHRVVTSPARLPLATFVESAEAEDRSGITVEIRPADSGWGESSKFVVKGVRGTEEVVLGMLSRQTVPESGWLRLSTDRATQAAVSRQSEALTELAESPSLLRQLTSPVGINTTGWDSAGTSLRGEGASAVVRMLQNQTMFALQGPPGTGKTEITSEAVKELLLTERSARILVSAQSHDAVDNLAERIIRKLEIDNSSTGFLALRIAGARAQSNEVVSPQMRQHLEGPAVQRLIRGIRSSCVSWLRTNGSSRPELAPIVQRWARVVDEASLELRLRLRRGANVVFTTTGAATRENLVRFGSPEPFDWVIVEEAARAWPTELALPLVRGTRWTLIGDQAQIGAFSRSDVQRFLESGATDPDEEIKAMAAKKDEYARVFDTFGSMFDAADGTATMTLTQQYRMHPDIAEVISSTFYAGSGGLSTMRAYSDHGITYPEWLTSRPLVWLDTDQVQRAEGFWKNPYEVDVVTALVNALRPTMERTGQSLAVLSPYRRQCEDLSSRLGSQTVHTIDAFQGREADVVIASLVRDRVGRSGTPISSVGHMAHPPRINVLLSRARDLLVVVGSFEVYAKHAGPYWANVTRTFSEIGTVLPVDRARLL